RRHPQQPARGRGLSRQVRRGRGGTVTVTEPTLTGRASGGEPLLGVKDLHVFYGNIAAVKGIGFEVHPGEIVTLIGSNGAGKSTTLRCISGLIKPRKGSVWLTGENITKHEGHDVVAKGI